MYYNWYLETRTRRITTVLCLEGIWVKFHAFQISTLKGRSFFSITLRRLTHSVVNRARVNLVATRHCTIRVTLRCFHVTIVAVEINKYYIFWVCVCSLRCPACTARAPYCHMWPAWLYNIFPQYLINGTIKKNIAVKMCILIFYTTFVRNIFHPKKNWATYDQTFVSVFMSVTRYSCPIWVKLEFSWQIFENCLNIKFNENPSIESRAVPCGQTHRHDEDSRRFSQFY